MDGFFGLGFNKLLSGGFVVVVKYINVLFVIVVVIDIFLGLMGEENIFNVKVNIICV